MTYKQRMARAWINLNCYRWDDFIGEKPENWDSLPDYSKTNPCKYNIISPHMTDLKVELGGEKTTSRAWWKYELKRSWFRWFIYWYFTRKSGVFIP